MDIHGGKVEPADTVTFGEQMLSSKTGVVARSTSVEWAPERRKESKASEDFILTQTTRMCKY
jgi:hypothetical protein